MAAITWCRISWWHARELTRWWRRWTKCRWLFCRCIRGRCPAPPSRGWGGRKQRVYHVLQQNRIWITWCCITPRWSHRRAPHNRRAKSVETTKTRLTRRKFPWRKSDVLFFGIDVTDLRATCERSFAVSKIGISREQASARVEHTNHRPSPLGLLLANTSFQISGIRRSARQIEVIEM